MKTGQKTCNPSTIFILIRMFKINMTININRLILLTIIFTLLAMYMNIHEEKIVYNFITEHIIALIVSLILSKILSNMIYPKL